MGIEQPSNEVAQDMNYTPDVSPRANEGDSERFDAKEQLMALRRLASLSEGVNT